MTNDNAPHLVADGPYVVDAAQVGNAAAGGRVDQRADPAKTDPLPASLDDGVYFGLAEADYHAAFALSASGIKHLRISTLDFWARSNLNPDREEEEESQAKVIGRAYHKRIVEGREAFGALYAPTAEPGQFALRTTDEIRQAITDAGAKPKGKNKAELIAQLETVDPGKPIWDVIVARHAELHHGKTLLPADLIRRIEISAAMIEKHPTLGKAFTGGEPEVSILWHDEEYGVPCKSRVDYLKPKAIIDLKSVGNPLGKPFDICVRQAIANNLYFVQAAMYWRAVRAAMRLIDEGRVFGNVDPAFIKALRSAKEEERQFAFIFQATGPAPVARGYVMPRGMVFGIGDTIVRESIETFAQCREKYGRDPWVDTAEFTTLDDAEFPAWIGQS